MDTDSAFRGDGAMAMRRKISHPSIEFVRQFFGFFEPGDPFEIGFKAVDRAWIDVKPLACKLFQIIIFLKVLELNNTSRLVMRFLRCSLIKLQKLFRALPN